MRLGKQLTKWPSKWPTDRSSDQSSDWPTDQMTDWVTEQLHERLTYSDIPTARPSNQVSNQPWPTDCHTRLLFSEEYPFNWPCSHHSPHWEEHRNCGRLKNNDERRIGWMRTWLNGTDNLVEWGTLFRGKAKVWFCYDSWEQSTTFLGVRSVLEVNCVVW